MMSAGTRGKERLMTERQKYKAYLKAEKKATKRRREGTKAGVVCSVCGKDWYGHDSYGDIMEHIRQAEAEGKRPWIKL